ncbi:MAG: HAD-IA family hydrolase [Bacillota bacterium]|nr:HAD-IA family hydrolase [Bacillota bacterium]
MAAARLGADPRRCIVFEDAEAGVEAAHRAGMYAVGAGSPDVLRQADHVIPGFAGLDPGVILELASRQQAQRLTQRKRPVLSPPRPTRCGPGTPPSTRREIISIRCPVFAGSMMVSGCRWLG